MGVNNRVPLLIKQKYGHHEPNCKVFEDRR